MSSNNSRLRPLTPQGGGYQNTSFTHNYQQYNNNNTFKNFNNKPTSSNNLRNQFNQAPQYPNLSKSRLSMNSSASGLAFLNQTDQNQMFPEDLVFLLKNQDRNINHFKQKIQKEKAKVQNDFVVLKNQIEHIIQDLKISVQAQLDLVYKTFITKYAEMKGQVQQLRKMRKQILLQNAPSTTPGSLNSNLNLTSNKDLIDQIEKDAQHFRSYKVYGYLSQLIKQKLSPILQLSTELILIGSAQCSYYRNKQMNDCFKDIKGNFAGILSGVYTNLGDYVYTPQAIVDRQRFQQENMNNTILKSMDGNSYAYGNPTFNFNNNNNHNKPISPSEPHFNMNFNQNSYMNSHSPSKNINPNIQSQKIYYQKEFNPERDFGQSFPIKVSSYQQAISTKWTESIDLNKLTTINTDHSQQILCVYFLNDKYVATGSRDKNINIYSIETGQKITKLEGHQAAICCLSSAVDFNNKLYLASGSDHKCCSLILWDVQNWKIISKVQGHSAAVTSILDLEDGYHLLTGSYDKKINLYNFVKGQIVYTLNSNKTSVTRMLLNADKSKVITSGLDCGLAVWQINRRGTQNNIVESIQQQRVIMNDKIICCMNTSMLRSDIVLGGSKDGKLKIFNIATGNIEKTYAINQNSVIQLFLIERQMKNDCPITLTCSAKDKSLIMTKTQTGISSFLKMDGQLNVEFGCGIGPKIVACQGNPTNSNKNGLMAIISQNPGRKQFSLYQMILK